MVGENNVMSKTMGQRGGVESCEGRISTSNCTNRFGNSQLRIIRIIYNS